jgi:hypothetical protein
MGGSRANQEGSLMTNSEGCVPTFQANLRHVTGLQPYIVSIVHPEVAGFRSIGRRLVSKQEINHAFAVAGIDQLLYSDALAAIGDDSHCCSSMNQNKAQNLQIMQTGSTK